MKKNIINDSSVHYSNRMKVSLLLVLLLFICLFLFTPTMKANPFVMRNDNKVIVLSQ